MSYMLETLESPFDTHGGKNSMAESISRKDVGLAWLAGVIEGEGCISVRWGTQTAPGHEGDNRMRTLVNIYNNHPFLLKRVTEILVENEVPFCYALSKRTDEKSGMAILVEGKGRVKKLLNLVMPYLFSKKRQAELTLEAIEYRESLAVNSREVKGRFGGMRLQDNQKLTSLIGQIRSEKTNVPSVLDCSRIPNSVLRISSTTLRSPLN